MNKWKKNLRMLRENMSSRAWELRDNVDVCQQCLLTMELINKVLDDGWGDDEEQEDD